MKYQKSPRFGAHKRTAVGNVNSKVRYGAHKRTGYAVLVEKVGLFLEKVGLFLEKVGLFWKKPYFFSDCQVLVV
jgi:hypothetical protein